MLLLLCGGVPSAPPHAASQSAIGKREYRMPGVLALDAVYQQSEEGWRHMFHHERATVGP